MSVAAISTAPSPATATPPPSAVRAADGDYKSANSQTVQAKDSDGDYKPLSATAQSSSGVQSSLSSLKVGG